MSRQPLTAEAVVALLGLAPHPEGGHFRETFRDPAGHPHPVTRDRRAHSTAILFLLAAGQRSAWHRVRDAVEVWHFHAGAPLRLSIAAADGVAEILLGADLAAGQWPQAVVAAGAWQCAETLGDWTLVGCTVAPGFDFAAFELAPGDRLPGGD